MNVLSAKGEAAHHAANIMPKSKPTPRPEDLAFPLEAEQLEIVVLLKEGKARTFRDLLEPF